MLMISYGVINLIYGSVISPGLKFHGLPILSHGLHGVFISKSEVIDVNDDPDNSTINMYSR